MSDFKNYLRKGSVQMRRYQEGEMLSTKVSISEADLKNGSPKKGDFIARNPENHDDQWLVNADFAQKNYILD